MAIGDAYASVPEYRAWVKDENSSASLVDDTYLIAISRYIDFKLGRKSGFNKDAAATERLYVVPSSGRTPQPGWAESENPWLAGGSKRYLDVEDIVTVTSIKLDEARDGSYSTTLSASDYELLPLNANTGPEPRPYKQIGMTEWGNYPGLPGGMRVKVTAIHGWPAVPEAIKVATIQFASILQLKSPLSTNRMNELDQVVESSPQTRAILMGLMTNYSAGIFF